MGILHFVLRPRVYRANKIEIVMQRLQIIVPFPSAIRCTRSTWNENAFRFRWWKFLISLIELKITKSSSWFFIFTIRGRNILEKYLISCNATKFDLARISSFEFRNYKANVINFAQKRNSNFQILEHQVRWCIFYSCTFVERAALLRRT